MPINGAVHAAGAPPLLPPQVQFQGPLPVTADGLPALHRPAAGALWAATRMLAHELAPRIRVNAVGPGPTLPSIHQQGDDFADEVAGTLSAALLAITALFLVLAPQIARVLA